MDGTPGGKLYARDQGASDGSGLEAELGREGSALERWTVRSGLRMGRKLTFVT